MWTISNKYLEEIKKSFKTEVEFNNFLKSCQIPLKKSIKIKLNKILPKGFENKTSVEWRKLTSSNFINNKDLIPEDIFYIDRNDTSIPLWKTFYHQSWFFYIQEISAGLAARQLFDNKTTWNEIILDMSSAPWWKSIQIWDYLQYLHNKWDLWLVISNDINKQRLSATWFNINRMGIFNSIITNFNWFAFWKNLSEFFDKVLLDAPCSWEWTWFKSDFWLKYWRKEEINKIASTQYLLLVSAIKATKPWWIIVFSTCTMNPYENEFNIKKILKEYNWIIELEEIKLNNKSPWLEIWDNIKLFSKTEAEKIARFWPHIQKTGWFFIAKLKKTSSLNIKNTKNVLLWKKWLKFEFNKNLQNKVKKLLNNFFGIEINENKHYFVETKRYVYLVSPAIKQIFWKIDIEKIWTPILKKNNRWEMRPIHTLWTIFWDIATKNFIEIDTKQAYKYWLWKNLEKWEFTPKNIDNPLMNYVIIKHQNFWIWIWKLLNWEIKNKYLI